MIPPEVRFRPFTTLEPSSETPTIMGGILHALRLADDPSGELVWYERVLPARFRRDLADCPGLKDYAVVSAEAVPAGKRSAAWERLLGWKKSFGSLDRRRRAAVYKLLGALCFYGDAQALAAAEPLTLDGPLDDVQANYDYLRVHDRFMLHEREMQDDLGDQTLPLLRIAERSPKGSRIRMISVLKFLVLNLEHKRLGGLNAGADALARETLRDLRGALGQTEYLCMESKYWRTACYFPFYDKLDREVDRQLDLAEAAADRAIAAARGGSDFEAGFAAENIHAVVATKAIVAMHRRDPAGALAQLGRMARLDPLGAWQRFGAGKALLLLGRPEEAREELQAGFDLAPPVMEEAYGLMARCLKELGKSEEQKVWERRAADRLAAAAFK